MYGWFQKYLREVRPQSEMISNYKLLVSALDYVEQQSEIDVQNILH